jgi:hypothetical protein
MRTYTVDVIRKLPPLILIDRMADIRIRALDGDLASLGGDACLLCPQLNIQLTLLDQSVGERRAQASTDLDPILQFDLATGIDRHMLQRLSGQVVALSRALQRLQHRCLVHPSGRICRNRTGSSNPISLATWPLDRSDD